MTIELGHAEPYAAGDPGPADVLLVIEVADTTRDYDRQVKLPLYARAGIAEAWLLDLQGDMLEVHRDPGPDGYTLIRQYHRGERVAPAALPDLDLPDLDLPIDDLLPAPANAGSVGQSEGAGRPVLDVD